MVVVVVVVVGGGSNSALDDTISFCKVRWSFVPEETGMKECCDESQ